MLSDQPRYSAFVVNISHTSIASLKHINFSTEKGYSLVCDISFAQLCKGQPELLYTPKQVQENTSRIMTQYFLHLLAKWWLEQYYLQGSALIFEHMEKTKSNLVSSRDNRG